jgi:hypothetical protein
MAAGQTSNSPCLDRGSGTAVDMGLDAMTTRADEETDTGNVDMGYHYPVTGRPLVMGDFDRDTDVDLGDFAKMQKCYTGAGPAEVTPCCRIFDFAHEASIGPDGDVDLDDYAELHTALTGP